MVIHEKHPNVLQYKESKHNIFFYTKWFACTMPAFTVMLQIGFLTCKREICFSTNITFFFERKCNKTRFVLESKQTFDEPPKKYLTPHRQRSRVINLRSNTSGNPNFQQVLGAIFILRKDIGVGGLSRKWQFSLTLCSENVLNVGGWVVQKRLKTPLRNIKMAPYSTNSL